MRYISLALCAPLLVLLSCGEGSGGTENGTPAPSEAVQAQQRIRALEDSLSDKALFDRRRLMGLRDVYTAYADRFPQDSLAPDMLRKAASTSGDVGEHDRAIALYDRLIKNYPDWHRTPDVYYFRAFELENGLGKKGEAKAAYEEFIAKFPNNQFADDAAKMIEYMGLTDEQLIERFRKMGGDSAAAATASGK